MCCTVWLRKKICCKNREAGCCLRRECAVLYDWEKKICCKNREAGCCLRKLLKWHTEPRVLSLQEAWPKLPVIALNIICILSKFCLCYIPSLCWLICVKTSLWLLSCCFYASTELNTLVACSFWTNTHSGVLLQHACVLCCFVVTTYSLIFWGCLHSFVFATWFAQLPLMQVIYRRLSEENWQCAAVAFEETIKHSCCCVKWRSSNTSWHISVHQT